MTNEEFIESIRLQGEEWRDVVGYENIYMVSSLGRVASLSRIVNTGNNAIRKTNQRILKPNVTPRGNILYEYINLCLDSKRVALSIHRMVAMAFIPNPNNYPEVDHIDRDGLNNHVSNLRWCNRSLNMQNENTRRVMSISQSKKRLPTLHKPVVQIKDGKVVAVFESITDAGRNGYTVSCVVRACKHQIHTHKGYCWEYLSVYEKSLVNQ